ncbi:uncharacterized protein LOC133792379 [Humulus lupulus]|uniref:uncharacterized protein LOC133792379 n=1 Tax=Humulus lupulus TaxID=3486 RepID=UPI002B41161A|nr:uncharacterized protein LOC133792379 [Humulus lupulus]
MEDSRSWLALGMVDELKSLGWVTRQPKNTINKLKFGALPFSNRYAVGGKGGSAKVDRPSKAVDYRPIVCCNTLYKCISKILCSRLSEVLSYLINSNQGAFIKRRYIAYNIIILQDLIRGYNRKGILARCVMKIDLSKAYDTIDWNFLEKFNGCLLLSCKVYFLGEDLFERNIRVLLQAAHLPEFRFHPLCKSLNLVGLCFADDLIILCKWSHKVIKIINDAFIEFCNSSGLAANKSNSHVYLGGVSDVNRKDILEVVQFEDSSFPLKYLGVTMRPTKWREVDCEKIIKKIFLKLNASKSRHLSFAGRAQLVHVVLLGTFSKVKEGVQVSCILLLGSRFVSLRCLEGLVFEKGGQDLWSYELKPDVSWYWRKLMKLKYWFSHSDLFEAKIHGKFKVSKIYNKMLPFYEKVNYYKSFWCRFSAPKHKFILWQEINMQFLTNDKLLRCKVNIPSALCPICELCLESHHHLFFDCIFSQKVVQGVQSWLAATSWPLHIQSWISWLGSKWNFGVVNNIVSTVMAATVYSIWINRNLFIFEGKSLITIQCVDKLIRQSIKARILLLDKRKMTGRDKIVLDTVRIM